MTPDPTTLEVGDPLHEAIDWRMTHSFRRVLVVEDGRLVGLSPRIDLPPEILEQPNRPRPNASTRASRDARAAGRQHPPLQPHRVHRWPYRDPTGEDLDRPPVGEGLPHHEAEALHEAQACDAGVDRLLPFVLRAGPWRAGLAGPP